MKNKFIVAALSIFSFSAITLEAQVPENVTVNSGGLPQANTPSTTSPSTDTKTTPTPKGKVKKNYPKPNSQTQDNKGVPAQRPSKKVDDGQAQKSKPEGKEHSEHHHDGDMDKNKGGEKGKHPEGDMRKNRPEGKGKMEDHKEGKGGEMRKEKGQGDNKGKGEEMRKKQPQGEGKARGKKPENHKEHDNDHDKDEK